jgi:hypothetical protein
MAKVIWKYTIPFKNEFAIEMPKGALILKAATQYGHPVMWALVDPAVEKEKRAFFMVETGASFSKAGQYIGSFLMHNDTYVIHLFEATKEAQPHET